MTTGTVQQQDHRRYTTDIDELYSATSGALADLLTYMLMKQKVHKNVFAPFFRYFADLFFQTCTVKHMREAEPQLIDQIKKWIDAREITRERVRRGQELFEAWGIALEKQGIHTLTK
jgi:hypothetical protein